MPIRIDYGRESVEYDVLESNIVTVSRAPIVEPITDVEGAVRQALDDPFEFPPLARAITPDDRIAIVVDETVPQLTKVLIPLLEYLVEAGINPEAISLVCYPPSTQQPWLDDLPESLEDIQIEIHDAKDRQQLSYLSTTTRGRRLYLNRTVVDADQLIVLTRVGFDPVDGYRGSELALFPDLCDEETQDSIEAGSLSLDPPSGDGSKNAEASEAAWLLGLPFFLQVIEADEGNIAHFVGGVATSTDQAKELLEARWRVEVEEPADVVLASVKGEPEDVGFAELGRALANAARVVKTDGKIVLLTDANPQVTDTLAVLQNTGDSGSALKVAEKTTTKQHEILFHWAAAAERATIYFLSQLSSDTAEELLTVPLHHAGEVQRLLTEHKTCVVLPEAHKMLATLK
ncbi:MAG: lactate racemase domain-containing protein [Gemmataceae bacterium]